jgi:putative tryptophan/tyrosine transport system substrate-binding protein
MRRREFITLVGGTTAAWPLVTRAQHSSKFVRIGMLEKVAAELNAANLAAFRKSLRDLGYAERQNLVIEYRSADGRAERFPEAAGQLVSLKVDVIVTRGTPASLAAKNATATIPIVMTAVAEPLGVGLIATLARPGGKRHRVKLFCRYVGPETPRASPRGGSGHRSRRRIHEHGQSGSTG